MGRKEDVKSLRMKLATLEEETKKKKKASFFGTVGKGISAGARITGQSIGGAVKTQKSFFKPKRKVVRITKRRPPRQIVIRVDRNNKPKLKAKPIPKKRMGFTYSENMSFINRI